MATIEEDGYENYINEKKGMAAAIYHPQYCEEGSFHPPVLGCYHIIRILKHWREYRYSMTSEVESLMF